MAPKKLHIPILYGSQTGNSQACAETLSQSLPSTLSATFNTAIEITSSAQQLDDFLEIDKALWLPITIIITSSYGVGQAPLGCWKFRDFCDAILEKEENNQEILKGVTYAMLGLGDSKYSTFFLNPIALDSALSKSGAKRIGSLGKADASGVGDHTQSLVMQQWCQNIVPDVIVFVQEYINRQEETESVELKQAKVETCKLCQELFDDWEEDDNAKLKHTKNNSFIVIVLVVLVSVVVSFFIKK